MTNPSETRLVARLRNEAACFETDGGADPEVDAGTARLLREAADTIERLTSTGEAVETGWVEYRGNASPVGEDVAVQVKFRDGSEYEGRAGKWDWHVFGGNDLDIVAYRLSAPKARVVTPEMLNWIAGALAGVHIAKAIPAVAAEYDFDYADECLRKLWVAANPDAPIERVSPREGHVEVPGEPVERQVMELYDMEQVFTPAQRRATALLLTELYARLAALPHNQGETKP